MRKYQFKSVVKLVVFGLIMSSLAIIAKAEEPSLEPSAPLIPPGNFNLNSFTGSIHLQSDHTNLTVLIEVVDDVENYMGKIYKPPIPAEEFSIWVLGKDNKFLPLISKEPRPGQTPIEVGNGGSSMAIINFRYKLDPTIKPMAVVLEVEDKFQVFKIRDTIYVPGK